MRKEALSLNPQTYRRDNLHQLTVNLADIALEAGDKPYHERINPFLLRLVDGKVINPQLGSDDILVYYKTESDLEQLETQAAKEIRDVLINEPTGTLALWFSPPNSEYNYSEGRLTVGYNTVVDDTKTMESYGIPLPDTTPENHLYLAWRLAEFSLRDYKLDSPEDLRSQAIIIQLPDRSNPWDFLNEYTGMPEVWDSIKSGSAQELKQNALQVAAEISPQIHSKIKGSLNINEAVAAIRFAETQMAQQGYRIDQTKLTCMFALTDTTYQQTYLTLDAFGQPVSAIHIRGEGRYVHNCGNCGREINKVITKGYQCSCGGVYEGC